MRNVIWIVLAALVALVGVAAYAQRAECAWCMSGPCWNKYGCGVGCSCVKVGGEMEGVCVSIE